MLKPCVSLDIMYPLRPSVWVDRGRRRQGRQRRGLAGSAGVLELGKGMGRIARKSPAGHVCQFAVQTAPIDFALPSGERKFVPGLVPYQAKYCVCDPGPVTPDCRAPRMDHWCLGQWLAVVPGVNSQIEGDRRFALR